MSVLIETTEGNLVIDLYIASNPDESFNFLKLCKLKYYHYSPFINIQKDFIVEAGNPEFPSDPKIDNILDLEQSNKRNLKVSKEFLKNNDIGLVSFFKKNKSTFESRFVITTTNDPKALKELDGKTTVFGKVVEGFSTLNKINSAILDETQRPLKDIRILHTFILDDPFSDEDISTPPSSPFPSEKQLESFRLLLDNDVHQDDILKNNEIKSTSQSLTLELLGDIPTSSIKPSENVLFICKLNPVTKEQDLKLIFSRFGKVKYVDIVKDKETGDSLCYGFIEFEDKKSVEAAYLKMDNVLIDDRRIHVDFSQSVKHTNKRQDRHSSENKINHRNYKVKDSYHSRHSGDRSQSNLHYRDRRDDRHRSHSHSHSHSRTHNYGHRSSHTSSKHTGRLRDEKDSKNGQYRTEYSSSYSRH